MCDKHLDIGSYSDTNDEIFNGEISFVQIHENALTKNSIEILSKIGPDVLPKGQLVGIRYTTDRRLCITPCIDDPTPGQNGSPTPPMQANLGQADYEPGTNAEEGLDDDEGEKNMETNLGE